ncbi:MAG: LPXTG cell wall anchor domain-containing protein, partial [Clostridia bacterium]|nr:LPXTG cell wall anchor domain-containing protein [Clostridia bacterium]
LSALFNRTTVAESEHETTSTRRFLIVRNTAYNRLADLYDSMTDPQITDVAVNWQNRTLRMMCGVTIRGTMTEVRRPGDESAPGVTFFACPGRDRQSAISLINDRKPFINPHQGYERTRVIPIIRKGVYATYSEYVRGSSCPDFVALNTPKEAYDGEEENPEPFIELFDGIMNRSMSNRRGVKLVQGDIRSIELFSQEDDVTRLFYTQAEVNADGVEQIRLHGLSIGPADDLDSHTRFDAIRTDYDLTLPTSRMAIGYIGATPYLYWWSAALRDGDEKQLVWRVWGAAYDPAADTLGDAHVLAQFQLPKIPLAQVSADHDGSGTSGEGMDAVVADVLLTASGTGYLVSTAERTASGETRPRVAAYSFKEQLKAVADVEIALPQATAVKAGDFEDIDIGIMNTGNLALAAFDVQMREVDAAGRAGNVVQTAHIDLIHPEKSSLALTGSKAELTGSAVAHRVEDYDYSPRQRDFILEKQMVRYRVALSPIVELESAAPTAPAENVHLSSDVLMPGSLGDFRTTFKIPDNWQGEKKLRLQVSSATVESNPLRAIADSSGLRPNAGDGGSVQLTYVLNEKTGKMALQRPPVANGAVANAIDSGIYPMEIEAGAAADLVTVIHDIDVDHRVYAGWDGSDWVDITVRNAAATGDALKLTCAVYPDGADTPSYVNLPYYRTATSDRHTQTLSMPVSALVGDETKHRQARVVISVVGAEECVLANNEFTVFPGGADPLRIEGQPASVEVAEGESARFAVTVAGGTKPYRCQWQVLVDGKWRDIPGATEATLQLEAVKTGWSGRKARCVVTDASGSTVISREVTLTVRPIPDTGDHSHLPLWLAVALLSATLLLLLRRKLRHT